MKDLVKKLLNELDDIRDMSSEDSDEEGSPHCLYFNGRVYLDTINDLRKAAGLPLSEVETV